MWVIARFTERLQRPEAVLRGWAGTPTPVDKFGYDPKAPGPGGTLPDGRAWRATVGVDEQHGFVRSPGDLSRADPHPCLTVRVYLDGPPSAGPWAPVFAHARNNGLDPHAAEEHNFFRADAACTGYFDVPPNQLGRVEVELFSVGGLKAAEAAEFRLPAPGDDPYWAKPTPGRAAK